LPFRWGFKAEAERLSLVVREELGLQPPDRLDPFALAEHLAIPVASLDALRVAAPGAVAHLCEEDPAAFSAATVFRGTRRLILFNPVHSAGRQANSLAHELAHVLLEHEPGPALAPNGCRVWDADAEDEADWLGGALLVPRDGIIPVLSATGSIAQAAEHFGVSVQLMTWRYNKTGVAAQLRRASRRRGSRA